MLSLFSGIGSFEKALGNAGVKYEVVGFSEIDKWAISAYCAIHNVEESLNLGDVSKIEANLIPECDLVTYGFPCQDISVAGLGKGIIEGETRSGLLSEALRVIDDKKPKYAIAENVKNLVGKRFKDDFDALLDELDNYGYNNYWKVLNAKDYGVPQNRERVFVVSIRKDVDNDNFKFPEGFDSGLRLKDLLVDEVEDKYYIENERTNGLLQELILDSRVIGNVNPSGNGMNGNVYNSEKSSPTITTSKGEGIKILEPNRLGDLYDNDGKRRQAGVVWDKEGVSPTIDTCQGRHREPLIVASRGRDVCGLEVKTEQKLEPNRQGVTSTLTTVQKDNLVLEPTILRYERTEYGKEIRKQYENGEIDERIGNMRELKPRTDKVSNTLTTVQKDNLLLENYRIRKLTPLECWRLMGFDDEDYWKVRKRLEDTYYNGRDRSNSQMYKMAGNSIVVDVLESFYKNLFSEWLV